MNFQDTRKWIISQLSYRKRNISPTDLQNMLEKEGFVKVCLGCGEKLTGRKRSWCDGDCSNEFYNKYMWNNIRDKLMRKYTKCQANSNHSSNLEIHHIHPIALGGDPFDEDNLIVICVDCHIKAHSQLGVTIKDYRQKEYYLNYVKINRIKTLDKFC